MAVDQTQREAVFTEGRREYLGEGLMAPPSAGKRFDDGKARFDLIPPDGLYALAMHYLRGSRKYADRNWEKGMAFSKCFGPLMRHAWLWWAGERDDSETGSHHMIAVAWNAIALYVYETRGIGSDDRAVATDQSAGAVNALRTLRDLITVELDKGGAKDGDV